MRGGQEGPLLTWGSQANSALPWSSLSMLRGLFLFCCLLFASCVEHKNEKGDGSRPWKEWRKFLPSDSVGEGDQCMQWSDLFKCRGPKLTKGPDFALGHSVPCGGPWPLAERRGLLTFPVFSDQLSLALWNKHQLVKDFSWAEGSNWITCITKTNHAPVICNDLTLTFRPKHFGDRALWRGGRDSSGLRKGSCTSESSHAFSQALLACSNNNNEEEEEEENHLSSFYSRPGIGQDFLHPLSHLPSQEPNERSINIFII